MLGGLGPADHHPRLRRVARHGDLVRVRARVRVRVRVRVRDRDRVRVRVRAASTVSVCERPLTSTVAPRMKAWSRLSMFEVRKVEASASVRAMMRVEVPRISACLGLGLGLGLGFGFGLGSGLGLGLGLGLG